MNPNQTEDPIIKQDEELESGEESDVKPSRRSGRRKIKIEYIEDKNRRHITFSKRKAGIMKKAYELSTLTGTQVLLLVVSETGLVYTFTTVKLQPIVTKPEGKNLIQACLNAPDPLQNESNENEAVAYNGQARVDIEKKPVVIPVASTSTSSTFEDKKVENTNTTAPAPTATTSSSAPSSAYNNNNNNNNSNSPYSSYNTSQPGAPMTGYNHPTSYLNTPYQQQQQQSPQQQPYGQMPGNNFYPNQQQQQQHYIPQQQHQPYGQPFYGQPNQPSTSPAMRQQQEDDKTRVLPPNSNNKK